MKATRSFVIFLAALLAAAGAHAQHSDQPKPALEFSRNGSVLTVKTSDGKEFATVDMDRPALKGKILAFTYSTKKKPDSEKALPAIDIYPNPASKEVNLQFKGDWKYPVRVQMFDKTGNALVSGNLESPGQPLNIGALTRGVYILKAQSGNASATEKLVVQ